jgi:predicted ATP-grasp superfamily ATP-dependent carboligase
MPDSFRAKGLVVRSRQELVAAARGLVGVVVTEIVPGPEDAFCSYYTYMVDGEPLFHFTKRKLRQYPVRWGTGTYHLGEWVPDAHETGLRLFRAAGLVGLGNVEFKRDERDHKLKLIECNLRLTAADPMIRASGLDLPGLLYDRALGREVRPASRFREGVRQWHPLTDVRALFDYRREGSLTAGEWARSLLHRQQLPLLSSDDLRPSWVNVRDVAGRALQKARR